MEPTLEDKFQELLSIILPLFGATAAREQDALMSRLQSLHSGMILAAHGPVPAPVEPEPEPEPV